MRKFLPKTVNNPQGFTLIELMVVISIIAVLSVVGVTLFNTAQKNARDARRKADIEAISKALEANYTSGSATPYPALTAAMFSSGAVPVDPQNTGTFVYTTSALPAVAFTTCAVLENTTGNATSNVGAGLGTVTNGGFFCRKNAQ